MCDICLVGYVASNNLAVVFPTNITVCAKESSLSTPLKSPRSLLQRQKHSGPRGSVSSIRRLSVNKGSENNKKLSSNIFRLWRRVSRFSTNCVFGAWRCCLPCSFISFLQTERKGRKTNFKGEEMSVWRTHNHPSRYLSISQIATMCIWEFLLVSAVRSSLHCCMW